MHLFDMTWLVVQRSNQEVMEVVPFIEIVEKPVSVPIHHNKINYCVEV